MRVVTRILSSFGLLCFGIFAIALAWFVPWVLTLHLGILAYFPYEPDGKTRFLRVTGPLWNTVSNDWASSEHIPKHCKNALVAAEDTRFFEHFGIDLESLERTYDHNKKSKRIRGGSTLTQQLVKNAFLSRDRSYVRKAREVIGAVILDKTMSKDSQLTWYFNVVEFGPNLYGISAASERYFKKVPAALNLRECVSLVSILPSPNKWNKSLVRKYPTAFLQRRISVIEQRMRIMGNLSSRVASASSSRSDKTPAALPKVEFVLPALPAVSNDVEEGASQKEEDLAVEPIVVEEPSVEEPSVEEPSVEEPSVEEIQPPPEQAVEEAAPLEGDETTDETASPEAPTEP